MFRDASVACSVLSLVIVILLLLFAVILLLFDSHNFVVIICHSKIAQKYVCVVFNGLEFTTVLVLCFRQKA